VRRTRRRSTRDARHHVKSRRDSPCPTAPRPLQLRAVNLGDAAMPTTQALHAYLRVSDASLIEIDGLEGTSYHDNAAGRALKDGSADPVKISGFVDRIYRQAGAAYVARSLCDRYGGALGLFVKDK
jgi:hypothetical protein